MLAFCTRNWYSFPQFWSILVQNRKLMLLSHNLQEIFLFQSLAYKLMGHLLIKQQVNLKKCVFKPIFFVVYFLNIKLVKNSQKAHLMLSLLRRDWCHVKLKPYWDKSLKWKVRQWHADSNLFHNSFQKIWVLLMFSESVIRWLCTIYVYKLFPQLIYYIFDYKMKNLYLKVLKFIFP